MLRDVLDRVRKERRTLTLFTHDGTDEVTAHIRRHFAVRNVDVTVREVPASEPAGFAVLHDDGDCVEACSLSALASYLSPDEWDAIFDTERQGDAPDAPALLEAVDDGVYLVENAPKLPLIRASHQIEHMATRSEPGTLFSGFQKVSNLQDDYGTWKRYCRLSEFGTDVHVFGTPDQQFPDTDGPAVHTSEADEIGGTWFVVYVGSEWAGLLIAEQTDLTEGGERYDGIISFRRDLAESAAEYLSETYLGEPLGDDVKRPN